MKLEVLKSVDIDPLKLATLIVDMDTGNKFSIRLPLSRILRDFKKIKVTEVLTGVQLESLKDCILNMRP
jgi:hypothetical protein